MSIIESLERYIDLPFSSENIKMFEDEFGSDMKAVEEALRGLSVADYSDLGRFYQRVLSNQMKSRLMRDPDLSKIIGYLPDPDMNFDDPPRMMIAQYGHDSELLSTLFKLKYNQILRVQNLGYRIPRGEMDIIESDRPYEKYIEMLNRKLMILMEIDDISTVLPETLMILNNEMYRDSEDVILPVFYLTKTETTTQVNVKQIREITDEIINMIQEGNRFERIMIIAMNRVATFAMDLIKSINYLSVPSGQDDDDVPTELEGIKIDVFSPSNMIFDLNSINIIPEHRVMSQAEVDDLLDQTGWELNDLQGISIEDPVVIYHGFNIDDVLEIKRKSAVNSEISDHSYAYRVVRPLPLMMSADETMMNKYLR